MKPFTRMVEAIKEERGYRLLEPWRYTERSLGLVVPIVRENYPAERSYFLLEEVKDLVELRDSGHMSKVYAKNYSGKYILARKGALLSGYTQPRAVRFTMIIPPSPEEQELEVGLEVRCVSASTPLLRDAKMMITDVLPSSVCFRLSESSQEEVWRTIQQLTSSINLGENNLAKYMEEVVKVRREIADVIRKFPSAPKQVGLFILDEKGVYAMEVFDHPDSWKAIAKAAAKEYSDQLAKQAEFFPFKPDLQAIKQGIRRFLAKLQQSKELEIQKGDHYKVAYIGADGIAGEYVELQNQAIYILAYRTPKPLHREEVEDQMIKYCLEEAPRRAAFYNMKALLHRQREAISKARATQILHLLKQKPHTWTEIKEALNLPDATLTRYLEELQQQKLITKQLRENGKIAYHLTAKGHYTLEKETP